VVHEEESQGIGFMPAAAGMRDVRQPRERRENEPRLLPQLSDRALKRVLPGLAVSAGESPEPRVAEARNKAARSALRTTTAETGERSPPELISHDSNTDRPVGDQRPAYRLTP
jgi:hypothetical protein